MPKMIATKKQTYNGKNISVGDVFTVRDKDVRVLLALSRVSKMTDVPAMTAENTSALVSNPVREHAVVVSSSPPVLHAEVVEENKEAENTSAVAVVEPQSSQSSQPTTEYSKMLRERARDLNIRVDYRWSDERIQREIDEHNKRTYQHMDIRSYE